MTFVVVLSLIVAGIHGVQEYKFDCKSWHEVAKMERHARANPATIRWQVFDAATFAPLNPGRTFVWPPLVDVWKS